MLTVQSGARGASGGARARSQTAYYSFYLPVAMAMVLAGLEKGLGVPG